MVSLGGVKFQMKAPSKPAWATDQMPDLEGKVVLVTGGSSGVPHISLIMTPYRSLILFGRCGKGCMQAAPLEKRKGLPG